MTLSSVSDFKIPREVKLPHSMRQRRIGVNHRSSHPVLDRRTLPPIVSCMMVNHLPDYTMMLNSKLTLFLIFSVCMLTVNIVSADTYRWYDKYGRAHYSNQSPNSGTSRAKLPMRSYNRSQWYDESSQKLVMYGNSRCGYCKKARKYLKKNRIPYTEYDIEKDLRAKSAYDQLGGQGVPLFSMGKKQMSGFNERSFEAFYQP